jgi:hypothetical protein
MIDAEDRRQIAADPFASGLEDFMTKSGKTAFIVLGLSDVGEGFSIIKGTGLHAVSLLLSLAIEYPDIFQSFMAVFTQLALEAGRDSEFFKALVEKTGKPKRDASGPAIMGRAKF